MKWTISGSSDLDEILIFLANGRQTYALSGLENSAYRLQQAESWRPGQHTLGDYRQTEPLKALFFPAREFIGRWGEPAGRGPMPERIVFGVKNCDLSALRGLRSVRRAEGNVFLALRSVVGEVCHKNRFASEGALGNAA